MPVRLLRLRHAIGAVVMVALLATCDDPYDNAIYDHSWFVRYLVSNQSSIDLTLRWGSELFHTQASPLVVPAGESKEIEYYEEFLGPPPDAGRSFTCISVHRASDDVLVFQLTPVKNSQWSFRELRKYHVEYTLKLTNSKLDPDGKPNLCGTLSGTATDSLTTAALDRFYAWFAADSCCSNMDVLGSASDGYFFMWPGDVPVGRVMFFGNGYQPREVRLPDAIEDLGDRHYRFNVDLVPTVTR